MRRFAAWATVLVGAVVVSPLAEAAKIGHYTWTG